MIPPSCRPHGTPDRSNQTVAERWREETRLVFAAPLATVRDVPADGVGTVAASFIGAAAVFFGPDGQSPAKASFSIACSR